MAKHLDHHTKVGDEAEDVCHDFLHSMETQTQKNQLEKRLKDLREQLESIYNEVHVFKFKILRPWITLTEGDAVGCHQLLQNACLLNKYQKQIKLTVRRDDVMAKVN